MSAFAFEKDHFDIIVDTDVAIDDWPAVLYVLNQKERSNLLGLSVAASGETHCEPGLQNLSDLVYLSGREQDNIPITCGDSVPLEGFHTFPDAWRNDADTLTGIQIPKNPNPNILKMHTVEWMNETLIKNHRSVVILTLGPLTNIAQLIQKYPNAAKKIKRIYTMGGAVGVKGNLIVKNFSDKLQNRVAEWNIWVDPLAAKIVFNSGVPLTLVPLDATNLIPVTEEYAKRLKNDVRSPAAEFYSKILDKNKWFIDSGEYYFWDPLAASVVYNPVCHVKTHTLDVVTKYDFSINVIDQIKSFGETFSSAFEQFKPYMDGRKAFEQIESGRTILSQLDSLESGHNFCINADNEMFTDDFIEVINRRN